MVQHTIVGGGIIGLLTAYYLFESGQDVTVLERGNIGGESSWAGGGIISPLYPWRYTDAVTQLSQWSQAHYPKLIARLSQLSDIDAEYIKSGLLILDTLEMATAKRWAEDEGCNLCLVNSAEIKLIEPALEHTTGQGLWMPDVAHVRNPRLLKLLIHYLTSKGVIIHENIEIVGFNCHNNRVQGLLTTQGDINTTSVAIACGAWSAKLMKSINTDLKIEPVKGQMIMIKTRPNLVRRVVLCNDRYIIPRIDGRLLVGSTLEYDGFNKDVTLHAKLQLLAVARRLIPALSDCHVERQWAGLRPGSPNNIPTISQHPLIDGLYINAGHFRNGVVTAPASARLLTDIMLKKGSILDQKPYILEN